MSKMGLDAQRQYETNSRSAGAEQFAPDRLDNWNARVPEFLGTQLYDESRPRSAARSFRSRRLVAARVCSTQGEKRALLVAGFRPAVTGELRSVVGNSFEETIAQRENGDAHHRAVDVHAGGARSLHRVALEAVADALVVPAARSR